MNPRRARGAGSAGTGAPEAPRGRLRHRGRSSSGYAQRSTLTVEARIVDEIVGSVYALLWSDHELRVERRRDQRNTAEPSSRRGGQI